MLGFLCVPCGRGGGVNGSSDDDDDDVDEEDCDDEYDGWQRFCIPTAEICFEAEHDDNGYK